MLRLRRRRQVAQSRVEQFSISESHNPRFALRITLAAKLQSVRGMTLLTNIQRRLHLQHPAPVNVRAAIRKAIAAARVDAFEVAPKTKVDLGKAPPASSAGDADFVTNLYRDLLDRAPDAGGMSSHLAGLATGMTRDEIRNVFLTSPEYREKHAAPVEPPPAPAPAPVVPPPPADPSNIPTEVREAFPQLSLDPNASDYEGQLRQIIQTDSQASQHRDATAKDYGYWLPMMLGTPDPGYWHKRLLGWEAGGDDMAKFGPYANAG